MVPGKVINWRLVIGFKFFLRTSRFSARVTVKQPLNL